MARPDVLIVGGGIIGAACARALAQRGLGVLVLESGPEAGAATPAAAGMLAPFAEAKPEDPLLALTVRGRDLYRDLAPALREETDIDIGLWTDGIVELAFTEEDVARAKGEMAWRRQSGFLVEWLSPEELRERLPPIGPEAVGATVAPEDGALDPQALHRALLKSARLHGAKLRRDDRVEEILIGDGAVLGVRTARRRGTGVRAGAVLVAAGCWSGRLPGLPRPVSVEPIRGQMLAMAWPEGAAPAIVYARGGYVLERHGEAIGGSTMEHAGFDARVTEAGLAHIRGTIARIFPTLADRRVTRSWAGLRPATPDGRPILGRDPEIANLWYATGHGRNGILLAGITGELLAGLFCDEEGEHDLSAMAPGRFWTT